MTPHTTHHAPRDRDSSMTRSTAPWAARHHHPHQPKHHDGPSPTPGEADVPAPTQRDLRCGASLATQRIDGAGSAAVSVLLPIGAALDPPDRLGRAAMHAELVCRDAGERSSRDIADAFDLLGASRSASGGMRYLSLGLTCLHDNLDPALDLLTDMIRRPAIRADAVDPARDLCLQAIKALEDDPRQRAALAARARHFAPPFDRSELGTEQGISMLTRDELAEAWQRHAVPAGTIVAAAGNVDADALAARLDGLFDGWTGAATAPEPVGTPDRGYGHLDDATNQVQIFLLHDAPPAAHADRTLESVVAAVLSGGMSGRLFTEVRERRGLCYAVSAAYTAAREFGAMTAYVGTTPERAQESLEVLVAELRRMSDGQVEAEEFDRAITGLKSRVVFSGEATPARAAALANDVARLGAPRSLAQRVADIDAVGLDELNAYLRRRRHGRLTIQTLGPASLRPPSDDALDA